MSFDKIFDLTAGVNLNFYNIILGCNVTALGPGRIGSAVGCDGYDEFSSNTRVSYISAQGTHRGCIFLFETKIEAVAYVFTTNSTKSN